MAKLSFLITSSTRSGTAYIAKLLTALGIDCTHETAFQFTANWWRVRFRFEMERPGDLWGDSSWLSMPYLQYIPERIPIFYAMRDPLATVNSIARQLTHGEPYIAPGQFAWQELGGFLGDTPEQIAVNYWSCWHLEIQKALAKRPNCYRYRTEDLTPNLVSAMTEIIGEPIPRSRIATAITAVSKRTNSRGIVTPTILETTAAMEEAIAGFDSIPSLRLLQAVA